MSTPVVARLAESRDFAATASMLSVEEVAAALDLRRPVTVSDLERRVLPSYDPAGRPRWVHAEVRVFCYAHSDPFGVGVTYSVCHPSRIVQELDLALPGLRQRSPRVLREVLRCFVHAVFRDDGSQRLRARIASGRGARAFVRLLGEIGALPEGTTSVVRPNGHREGRLLLWLSRERFYESAPGRRATRADDSTLATYPEGC